MMHKYTINIKLLVVIWLSAVSRIQSWVIDVKFSMETNMLKWN